MKSWEDNWYLKPPLLPFSEFTATVLPILAILPILRKRHIPKNEMMLPFPECVKALVLFSTFPECHCQYVSNHFKSHNDLF